MSETSTFGRETAVTLYEATKPLRRKGIGAIFLVPDDENPDEVHVRVLEIPDKFATARDKDLTALGLKLLKIRPTRNYIWWLKGVSDRPDAVSSVGKDWASDEPAPERDSVSLKKDFC